MKKFFKKLLHRFYKWYWAHKGIYKMCIFSIAIDDTERVWKNVERLTKICHNDLLCTDVRVFKTIPVNDCFDDAHIQNDLRDCCDEHTVVVLYAEDTIAFLRFWHYCTRNLYLLDGTKIHSVMRVVQDPEVHTPIKSYRRFPHKSMS